MTKKKVFKHRLQVPDGAEAQLQVGGLVKFLNKVFTIGANHFWSKNIFSKGDYPNIVHKPVSPTAHTKNIPSY